MPTNNRNSSHIVGNYASMTQIQDLFGNNKRSSVPHSPKKDFNLNGTQKIGLDNSISFRNPNIPVASRNSRFSPSLHAH